MFRVAASAGLTDHDRSERPRVISDADDIDRSVTAIRQTGEDNAVLLLRTVSDEFVHCVRVPRWQPRRDKMHSRPRWNGGLSPSGLRRE